MLCAPSLAPLGRSDVFSPLWLGEPLFGLLHRFLDPNVARHLLSVEGEIILDEVRKHWAAIFWPLAGLVGCIPVFLSMIWAGPFFWFPMLAGTVLFLVCLWKIHVQDMDRFVITNMRVFRVHGVFNQQLATMPINRILDITVRTPFFGQLLGYGHFVFETAAQDQGLREITFVGSPGRRDLLIQQIIQRSGLRAQISVQDGD